MSKEWEKELYNTIHRIENDYLQEPRTVVDELRVRELEYLIYKVEQDTLAQVRELIEEQLNYTEPAKDAKPYKVARGVLKDLLNKIKE